MKTIESRIAPNPMEAKIWIDLSADPHGMVKKYWDGTKWVEENLKYKGLEEKDVINLINNRLTLFIEQLNEIRLNVNILSEKISNFKNYNDENIYKMINDLSERLDEVESNIIMN